MVEDPILVISDSDRIKYFKKEKDLTELQNNAKGKGKKRVAGSLIIASIAPTAGCRRKVSTLAL